MSDPQTREELDEEIARLTALRAKAPPSAWPKTIAYHLHGSKEQSWEVGKQLGLPDAVNRGMFRYCCSEITLTLQVSEDGIAVATHVDGVALVKPIPVSSIE